MFFSYRPYRVKSVIVDSVSKLKKLAKKMENLEEFAFDTETNTLRVLGPSKDFSIVGISISWGAYNNYYIPLGHRREEDFYRNIDIDDLLNYIKPIFERYSVRIIGHNIKFDMHVLSRIGIHIKTYDLFDTMIASWLCDENTPNGLKENTQSLLGVDQTHFKEVTDLVPKEIKKAFGLKANSKATFDLTLIDDSAPYALDDAFYTWELYQGYMHQLEQEGMDKVFYKVYVPFIRTLYKMEENGVTIDLDKLEGMHKDIQKDKEDLEYRMFELAGVKFNPSSSQQLTALLFGYSKKAIPPDERDDEEWVYSSEKEKEKIRKNYEKAQREKEATLGPLLRNSFNFRVISSTATGIPQVNADVLWKISNLEFRNLRKKEGVELCKLLSEYKKLDKLSSAFIDGLYEQMYDDGKVHPSFNIIGTDSGRLSCSNPNLQQLPKAEEEDKYQIRSLFIGSLCVVDEDGEFQYDFDEVGYVSDDDFHTERKKIVALDFSNLEMRVLAHFSKDENLLNMFASGDDTHGSTAVNMFELKCTAAEVKKKYPHLRQAAKILNFMLMYGGGASRLYSALKEDHYNPIDLGDKSYLDTYHARNGEEVAQIYIDKYFSTYKGVAKFIRDQKRYAHKHGYVYTLLRRKRRLPDINGHDFKMVSYCERLAVNSAIQGSAADITMSAQNRIDKDGWFKDHGIRMLIQVHDELVFECPAKYVEECISRVQHYMENCFGDNVKLNLEFKAEADFGDSYQEAK